MKELLKWVLIIIPSLWGCVYVGSLIPQLWRQQNYRGAVGMALLASVILVLPIVLSIFR